MKLMHIQHTCTCTLYMYTNIIVQVIRESVDSLYRDDTDPYRVKSSKLSNTWDSKAFWIAYCVSGVVAYP